MPMPDSSDKPLKPDRPTGAKRKKLMRLRRRARRLPAGADPGSGDFPRGAGPSGGLDGGAGVREPRHPKPSLPAMGAEAPEPVDRFLEVTTSRA